MFSKEVKFNQQESIPVPITSMNEDASTNKEVCILSHKDLSVLILPPHDQF